MVKNENQSVLKIFLQLRWWITFCIFKYTLENKTGNKGEQQLDMLVKKETIFDNIVAVSGTKKEAIRTISRLCAKQTLLDATQLEKAFWKREEWDSTGCGEGIAIPHAIIKEIDEVQLFIVRFRYPIEWESFDDKKVDIAFVIIAPEEKGQEKYLVFLSRLARKLVDEKFVADFRNYRSTEAVYQYVKNELE